MEALEQVKDALRTLSSDNTLPKNFKIKVENTLDILNNETIELSLRINKALHSLDELTDEANIESFVRTQIWNIVSMLESIN